MRTTPFDVLVSRNLGEGEEVFLSLDLALLQEPADSEINFFVADACCFSNLYHTQRLLSSCQCLIYVSSTETYILCIYINYNLSLLCSSLLGSSCLCGCDLLCRSLLNCCLLL